MNARDPHIGNPDAPPFVFVIDADASVRESFEVLILSAGWRARTCGSAREFLEHSRARVPSCLVVNPWLPDIDGLDLQQRVAADRDELPIVFVAEYGDVPTAVRAMKAGAVDFLTKPFHEGPLVAAISDAIERSRAALKHVAQLQDLSERHARLTPREREVMALVTAGRLNKQMAADLGISEITVKAHRGRMMRKMRAHSLAPLVDMAARLGVRATIATVPPSRACQEGVDRHLCPLDLG